MRVTGEAGDNLGVMPLSEALALARPEEGLDLIEVIPNATPPVVRVMSFDKYRYVKEKEEKKLRQTSKAVAMKQVQFTARAADHDRLVKVHQLEKFLTEGHPVEVQMKLRGREKGMKDWQKERLDQFLGAITVEYKVIMPPRPGGRGVIMQVAKKS